MMKDKLLISGLEFQGHCGITHDEQKAGQRISVDLEIGYDVAAAAKTDDLDHAMDYAAISNRLAEIGRKEPFHLIESLADRMAHVLVSEFGAREIRLRLKKLHPPVECIKKFAAVEIYRSA